MNLTGVLMATSVESSWLSVRIAVRSVANAVMRLIVSHTSMIVLHLKGTIFPDTSLPTHLSL